MIDPTLTLLLTELRLLLVQSFDFHAELDVPIEKCIRHVLEAIQRDLRKNNR